MGNIFETVKNRLDNKRAIKFYLGKPEKVVGNSNIYSTPFRKDCFSNPSLSVSEDYIKDFGGEFKGDIINFVSQLKGISPLEAVKLLVKDFKLDIDVSTFRESKDTIERVILEIGESPKEIITMFDIIPFAEKPKDNEIALMKQRIKGCTLANYSLKEIQKKIVEGHTSIPAGIKGQVVENWRGQQVFMLDIDNMIKVEGKSQPVFVDDEKHVTVTKIIEKCKQLNLEPTFIYYTFSHTENQNKMRLVYILEEATRDIEIAKNIYKFLLEELKEFNIDHAPTDLSSTFFGGKEIAYTSNVFYKVVKKQIQKQTIEELVDYGEYNSYIDKLVGTQYLVKNQKLKVETGKGLVNISNFLPIIEEQVNYNNGKTIETEYKVHGFLLDKCEKLPTVIITKEELDNFSFVLNPQWKLNAIICAGINNKDKIREVAQIINKDSMESKEVYAHTGFIKIDGKLNYLYHGGAIGGQKDITVDLSGDKLEQYCFTNKEFERIEALKIAYLVITLADISITIPLLSTLYLAPIVTILGEEGIFADYILWIEGKTGTRKSSLAALLLSHFGQFSRNNFPSSFRDTLNSLEKKAFIAKDTLTVIDDYNPETIGNRKQDIAEKLFGMYGDRAGRDRMCQDGKTLRSPYTARGLCIITGESFPEVAQSRHARSVIVDIKSDSIDLRKLSYLQRNTDKLAFAMKQYIDWIIVNEDRIRIETKETMQELQEQEKIVELHGRTNEAIAEGYLYVPKGNDRRTIRRKMPNSENSTPFIAIYKEKIDGIYIEPMTWYKKIKDLSFNGK